MRAIERLGITKAVFKKMYEEYGGFNNQFNKNHPSYNPEETFLEFLNAGSKSLMTDNLDLILDIIVEDR